MSKSQDLFKSLSWANVLLRGIWQSIRRELDSFTLLPVYNRAYTLYVSLEANWKEGHSSQLTCELIKRRARNNYNRLAVIVQMRKIHKGRN